MRLQKRSLRCAPRDTSCLCPPTRGLWISLEILDGKGKETNIQILANLVAIDPCTIGTLVPESKLNLTLCKRRHYEEDNNEDAKNAVSSRRRPEKNPSLVLDNLTLALRNCGPPLLRAHIRLPRRRENINSICGIQGLHCTYLTLPDHIIT